MKYRVSVLLVTGMLLLFLASFFLPAPQAAENSENRTMATFRMVLYPEKGSVVYHNSPVERLDAALSDQFPFRESMVRRYLRIFNAFENLSFSLAARLTAPQEKQYSLHALGNYVSIADTGYITAFPAVKALDAAYVRSHVQQLEVLHQSYPDLRTYVYFVSQAYDTSWFDRFIGTKTADHYGDILSVLPAYVKSDHLVYRDLDDYTDLHYRTDHHWNHRGAQRGYEDVFAMLQQDFPLGEIRIPKAENPVSQIYDFVYRGSYGKSLGSLYTGTYDDFSFYEYDLPVRETAVLNPETYEEIPVAAMGLQEDYRVGTINKALSTDHYISMYGTAVDEAGNRYADSSYPFIIHNCEGCGSNLLICGDSLARPLRDLLASHFDTTVYIDYRILSQFPIDRIIEKYQIDALLICSNSTMWSSEEYMFMFEEAG